MDIAVINLWTISQWPIECHDLPIKLVDFPEILTGLRVQLGLLIGMSMVVIPKIADMGLSEKLKETPEIDSLEPHVPH
jgi:hypothetical protein